MASIEPYNFREKTNLQEHNDIINKVNEIVDVINDTDLDNIGTRLTNDESQIAVNTAGIKANTSAIDGLSDSVDTIDKTLDTIDPMVDNHEIDIANLKESERRLSNDVVSTYTLYRNGEGKIKAQMETVGGTLIDSNTLDMIIPYQYDIISGTTDRSFKLSITMSDGSSYTTNDFIIPEGGGSEIVVTGITLSKDSTNVNRFHVGINLSDSTMIDSGYISMVDNVVATFTDSKLTISVNGVSSVPVAIDVSGEFTAGTGIVIDSGTISIDDTVVALKSDIADMLTKTDADAEYATKTALASTDANVESVSVVANEAKSTADDAKTTVNSCFDNVTIADNVLTFTKPDDTHVDITLPTSRYKEISGIYKFDFSEMTFKYSTGNLYSSTVGERLSQGTVINNGIFLNYNYITHHQYVNTNAGYLTYDNYPTLTTKIVNAIMGGFEAEDGVYSFTMRIIGDETSEYGIGAGIIGIHVTIVDNTITKIFFNDSASSSSTKTNVIVYVNNKPGVLDCYINFENFTAS